MEQMYIIHSMIITVLYSNKKNRMKDIYTNHRHEYIYYRQYKSKNLIKQM